eukprot:7123537-Pyramimonas_sp.AAC.2
MDFTMPSCGHNVLQPRYTESYILVTRRVTPRHEGSPSCAPGWSYYLVTRAAQRRRITVTPRGRALKTGDRGRQLKDDGVVSM